MYPIIHRGLKKSGAPAEVIKECDKGRKPKYPDAEQVIADFYNAVSESFNNPSEDEKGREGKKKQELLAEELGISRLKVRKILITTAITGKITSIKTAITNGFNNAKTAVTNVISSATSWGSDLVNNIASGIRGAISTVTSVVSRINAMLNEDEKVWGR